MSIGIEVSSAWVVLGMFIWGNSIQLGQINYFSLAYPLWRQSRLHDCLPVVHARQEGCLRVDLQKDGLRESSDVGVLYGCFMEASPSGEHLKVGCVFLCGHAWHNFECMQLGTCCPFPVWVSEGLFDGHQESF